MGVNTSRGMRIFDNVKNGKATEIKTGRTYNSKFVKKQVAKDVEAIRKGKIKSSHWRFEQSAKTGKLGPSKALEKTLSSANKATGGKVTYSTHASKLSRAQKAVKTLRTISKVTRIARVTPMGFVAGLALDAALWGADRYLSSRATQSRNTTAKRGWFGF